MKITLLLLFSFVVISTCSAQITQGTTFVGGSGSYSSQTLKSIPASNSSNKIINTKYQLNPKAGFIIAENIALGLGFNYSRDKTVRKPNNLSNSSFNQSFGVSPFGRYYKMLGEKAGFFGQLTVTYAKGKSEYEDVMVSKYSSIGTAIAPGFVFFATPKIGIETTVGNLSYLHSNSKSYNQPNSSEITTNHLTADIDASNIFLGINFYLNR